MRVIQLMVTRESIYGTFQWRVVPVDYDYGDPIGFGSSIPEALEDFEDCFAGKYNYVPKYNWT